MSRRFRERLTEKITEIESVSGAETVITVSENSGDYQYLNLCSGIFFGLSAFTYTMFSPEFFPEEWIYFSSLIGFGLGYLFFLVKPLAAMFVSKEKLGRNTEIYARACFQKGKIYETSSRQGILIYISMFERTSVLIGDRNASLKVPVNEWNLLREKFQKVFHPISRKKTEENILLELSLFQDIMKKYIPESGEINEIPDGLEIFL
ncbi:MAG TPA: hypothetical protein PK683_02080 [Leptospiraceae bacterium]|nr:hypothetical protein [Leptospiraceae bacterium]HNI94753.1 hypothetical protein [Leptospiraceae bacterium]